MNPLRFPEAQPRPECIDSPAGPPRLDPRPMPALRIACRPVPRQGAAQRYHMPLWRLFEKLGD